MFNAQYIKDLHFIQTNHRKIQTQRTKRENEKKDLHIQEDIRNYFKKGGIPLLDRMPPNYSNQLHSMLQHKSTSGITFTYRPELREKYNEIELRQYIIRTIRTIALNRDMPLELTLIPDCDEAGNYHYHGAIKLPIKYRPSFKKLITEHIGYMKFDYITNADGWFDYCFKHTLPPLSVIDPDKGRSGKLKQTEYTPVYTEAEIQHLGIYLNI